MRSILKLRFGELLALIVESSKLGKSQLFPVNNTAHYRNNNDILIEKIHNNNYLYFSIIYIKNTINH